MPDKNLLTYATEKQAEYIRACIEHGTQQAAATELGVYKRTVERALQRVRKTAQRKGYDPDNDLTRPASGERIAKRVSTNYDETGAVRQQWVITEPEKQAQIDAIRETVEALKEEVPRAVPAQYMPYTNDKLASVYILTDAHIGMMAWGEETGADWDVDIAENTITNWITAACNAAPDSHTAVLAQMGDLLHFDGLDAVTPESGHVLDADTRYARTVRIAIRVMRRVIDHMLTKHKYVHVMNCDANHDPSAGIWMSELIDALYENDERVTVDQTKNTYYCFEWGNTSVYFHHGHRQKVQDISRTFAGIYREVFGRTKYSYAHLGHVHHTSAREDQLMIVETHPTLAAMDAYAARSGYNSQRGASVITYHRNYGEVTRSTIRPEMVYNEELDNAK